MEIKIIDAEFVADRMVINYTEDGKVRSLIIAPEEIIRYRNAAQQSVQADGALCADCGKSPAMEGCTVCAECGL